MWRILHDCMAGVAVLARSIYVPDDWKAKCTPNWWGICGECCPRRRTVRYDSGESGYQAMVWRMSFPLTMKMTISATLVA